MIHWKGYGRKRSWPNLIYYPCICLEELSKTTKHLSQNSRSRGLNLNTRSPEYKAGMLTTRPRRSILLLYLTPSLTKFSYEGCTTWHQPSLLLFNFLKSRNSNMAETQTCVVGAAVATMAPLNVTES
jgi:hypothetical protein